MFNIWGQFKVIFHPKYWQVVNPESLFLINIGFGCEWLPPSSVKLWVDYHLTTEKLNHISASRLIKNNFLNPIILMNAIILLSCRYMEKSIQKII